MGVHDMAMSRRDLLKAAGAGLLMPEGLLGTRNVWGAASSGKPQSYALIIGLNAIDAASYGLRQGEVPVLKACINDAASYLDIAKQKNFTRHRALTDGEATRDEVRRHLVWAANNLTSGDLFFVAYAGHGSQVPDRSGEEASGYNQTWCLWDGQMIDDELYEHWCLFQPGVRILMISDSCHSGTVARLVASLESMQRELQIAGSALSKSLGRHDKTHPPKSKVQTRDATLGKLKNATQGRDLASGDLKSLHPLIRGLPPDLQDRAYRQQQRTYDAEGKQFRRRGRSQNSMQASGLLLAGCQDSQTSAEYGEHGFFTAELIEKYGAASSYQQLLEQAAKEMGPQQIPNFYPFGVEDQKFYYKQPPFMV